MIKSLTEQKINMPVPAMPSAFFPLFMSGNMRHQERLVRIKGIENGFLRHNQNDESIITTTIFVTTPI
jgi:hypothetical protein